MAQAIQVKDLPRERKFPNLPWWTTPPEGSIATEVKLPETPKGFFFTEYTKAQAQKVARQLRPFVGKKIYFFGGGGSGYRLATLRSIKATPQRYFAQTVGETFTNFEQDKKNQPLRVISGYRYPKGAGAIDRKEHTYERGGRYNIIPTLAAVGKVEAGDSMFARTRYYGKDGNTPLKRPITTKQTFSPHLGSWKLAIPNIYLQRKARVGRSHYAKREKTVRETGGKVKGHSEIRDTCKYCGGPHSSDKHRFHGVGSYGRTHAEERMF